MNFILCYASRARPDLFRKRVANWTDTASGLHNLEWRCAFDVDDPTMMNPAMQQWCIDRGIRYGYGYNRGKVEAIMSGGAPLAPRVQEFMQVAMCCAVMQVCAYARV
jgi:long-subunit acyl-CoA synthetase (AMP-forming)